jgi:hypothetical protein
VTLDHATPDTPTAADAAIAQRQSAWLDTVRAQGRGYRFAGFIACLLGVMILIVGRYKLGGPTWLLITGAGVVAVGWGLFVYALARRLMWVRAHPFDPNG